MSIDVVDLRNFYGQRLGVVARRFIARGIRSLWGDTTGQRVLGIGYATPYLGLFREEAERCLAFIRRCLHWWTKTNCRSLIPQPTGSCWCTRWR
jgi:hypothetical protein